MRRRRWKISNWRRVRRGGRRAGGKEGAEKGRRGGGGVAEREERLRVARERIQHYDDDDTRMAAGPAMSFSSAEARAELEAERAAAARTHERTEPAEIAARLLGRAQPSLARR